MGSRIRRKLTRRQLLAELSSITLFASALAACSPSATPPAATQAPAAKPAATEAPKPAATTAAPAVAATTAAPAVAATAAATAVPAAAQIKKGGTLKYGKVADILGKDPHKLSVNMYGIVRLGWDTPIRFDEKLQPQPWLAESWDFAKDFLSVTLKLRKGVKFHTGREFTAEDVKFNIERVRKPETASQMRNGADKVKEMVIGDPYTITLKFAEPNPSIWDTLETLYIVDKENIDDDKVKEGIGTGPFKWVEWRPNDRVVFERNPNYWAAGLPYLDRVEVTVIKDLSALSINLEAGALDIAEQPANIDFVRLRDAKKFQPVVSDFWSDFYYLGAVVDKPPMSNKKFRQALNYAIDRKRFVDTVLSGIGEAQAIPWPKYSPVYIAEQAGAYKYDLDKAKQLMQEAGVGNPTITLTTNAAGNNHAKLAELLQADFVKIGVTLKVEAIDQTVFQANLSGAKFDSLWVNQFGFAHMSPVTLFTLAFPWRVGGNSSKYVSDDYAKFVSQAGITTDPAAAKAVYKNLNQLILDESFMMTISPQVRTWALAPSVKAFTYGVGNYINLEKCWLDK